MAYKGSLGPWKDDSEALVCDNCEQPFTRFTRRRHHCRCCGNIFCEMCCHARLVVPNLPVQTPQRVCFPCCAMLLSRSNVKPKISAKLCAEHMNSTTASLHRNSKHPLPFHSLFDAHKANLHNNSNSSNNKMDSCSSSSSNNISSSNKLQPEKNSEAETSLQNNVVSSKQEESLWVVRRKSKKNKSLHDNCNDINHTPQITLKPEISFIHNECALENNKKEEQLKEVVTNDVKEKMENAVLFSNSYNTAKTNNATSSIVNVRENLDAIRFSSDDSHDESSNRRYNLDSYAEESTKLMKHAPSVPSYLINRKEGTVITNKGSNNNIDYTCQVGKSEYVNYNNNNNKQINFNDSRYNLSSLRHFTSTPYLSEVAEDDSEDEDVTRSKMKMINTYNDENVKHKYSKNKNIKGVSDTHRQLYTSGRNISNNNNNNNNIVRSKFAKTCLEGYHSDSSEDSSNTIPAFMSNIFSSSADQPWNNLAFISSLQNQLVDCDAENVLHVLLFPSTKCYAVTLVTVSEEETMSQLAERLCEAYFRLSHGPCNSFRDRDKEELLPRLQFYTEMLPIKRESAAATVAAQCTHIVLTTLTLEELQELMNEGNAKNDCNTNNSNNNSDDKLSKINDKGKSDSKSNDNGNDNSSNDDDDGNQMKKKEKKTKKKIQTYENELDGQQVNSSLRDFFKHQQKFVREHSRHHTCSARLCKRFIDTTSNCKA